MKIREIVDELERMRQSVGDKNWETFKDTDVLVHINGQHIGLELTAICGSHFQHGIEAVIQNKVEWS